MTWRPGFTLSKPPTVVGGFDQQVVHGPTQVHIGNPKNVTASRPAAKPQADTKLFLDNTPEIYEIDWTALAAAFPSSPPP